MNPDSAEETISSLFASRMIDREIKYEEVMDNPDDDPVEEVLERQYEVSVLKRQVINKSLSFSNQEKKRKLDLLN